jgi:hypothetical protein
MRPLRLPLNAEMRVPWCQPPDYDEALFANQCLTYDLRQSGFPSGEALRSISRMLSSNERKDKDLGRLDILVRWGRGHEGADEASHQFLANLDR